MHEVKEGYRETYDDCETLLRVAIQLSVATHGREVATRGLESSAIIFAKICSHAKASLDLAPQGPLSDGPSFGEFWDLSSMAVLVRAEMEAYYSLFYIAVDHVEEEVEEFRWLLWDHHSEKCRLNKLELVGSTSNEMQRLRKDVDELTDKIMAHPVYLNQKPGIQKKLRNGDLGIFVTNTELSRRAGIDPDYYNVVFKFLSSYAHAHPFCIGQLAVFQANEQESLSVMSTVLRYSAVYLSFAIRDFVALFPDCQGILDSKTQQLVMLWCDVAREGFQSRKQ